MRTVASWNAPITETFVTQNTIIRENKLIGESTVFLDATPRKLFEDGLDKGYFLHVKLVFSTEKFVVLSSKPTIFPLGRMTLFGTEYYGLTS